MIPLNEQILIFERCAEDCFDAMIDEMVERKDDIIELGMERLLEGFEEYGDEMFTWDDARRDMEWMQEVADACVYKVSECG